MINPLGDSLGVNHEAGPPTWKNMTKNDAEWCWAEGSVEMAQETSHQKKV